MMDRKAAENLLDVVIGHGARAATNEPSRAKAEGETLASAIGVVENTHQFLPPLPAQPAST